MTDTRLIVAECRAGDLLATLQSAVNGDAHWRPIAKALLADINNLVLPPPLIDQLRAIDGRKRAAKCMDDLCRG